ncbi:MAG: MarR family transcriptional regulator [Burkholderiaceae bacterium]
MTQAETLDDASLHSLLYQASREATADLRRVIGAEGMPVEFWRVLEVLADERGRTMSALAEQTGMLLPATSKLVDRMTEAALIQRSIDPRDNRRVILHISDFGLAKVAALRGDLAARRREVARSLTPSREKQLRQLLTDFIRLQQSAG